LNFYHYTSYKCEGVSKSFRTGRLERELQMIQLSATRCSCIAIQWVSLKSFAVITLCFASQRLFLLLFIKNLSNDETWSLVISLTTLYRMLRLTKRQLFHSNKNTSQNFTFTSSNFQCFRMYTGWKQCLTNLQQAFSWIYKDILVTNRHTLKCTAIVEVKIHIFLNSNNQVHFLANTKWLQNQGIIIGIYWTEGNQNRPERGGDDKKKKSLIWRESKPGRLAYGWMM
jgi:hypothetical protein